ncbi:MAG: hypothetical protein HN368_01060 [Spirochaetales bacterium]|jgi:hypothetical protein|nr:hypothetical protein [Spirochaetales bacterium]
MVPILAFMQLAKGLDLFQIGLVMQLGAILGALLLGYISNTVSIPLAWRIGAILLLLSSISYLSIPR